MAEMKLAPLDVLVKFFPDPAMFWCGYVAYRNKDLKAFPKWRENQFVKFIGQLISNVDEMKTAYEQRRIMRLSWAVRNLLELSVWIDYCNLSNDNAERFHKDSAKDAIDWANTIQKIVSGGGGSNIAEIDLATSTLADRFSLEETDMDFKRISNAAKELGRQESFAAYNKLYSKFAHPTAWSMLTVLAAAVETDEDIRFMFLQDGVSFAIKALGNARSAILESLPLPEELIGEVEQMRKQILDSAE